jgi:GT2 family glycosyltransferase
MRRATSAKDRPDLPDAGATPLVVSIVVNFRGIEQTRVCVASLLAVDYPNHSVVVVDNASGESEVEALREAFGASIQVIASERNLGYGGGANLGLEWALAAGAAYAWVLNNDTQIDPCAVRRLVDAMERETGYGVMSPQIDAPIGPESPFGVWYAGGMADLARVLTKHEVVPTSPAPAVEPTGYVTGCAMFLRCKALEQTGLFWAPFFLYWEDVDLSFRMRRAGWRLGVVPAARIVHFVHGSVQSKVVRYYYYRNAVIVANRHLHGRGAARAFMSLATRALRRLAASLLKRDGPLPVAETRGLLAGAAAVLGLRRVDNVTGRE